MSSASLTSPDPSPGTGGAVRAAVRPAAHPHADVVPVVEAAAVIGRAGDLPLLRSVVGRDAKDVDDVVTELVRARVLERRGTDGWRFRHELLREVAAELAPPSLRRDLHARAARALVDAAAAAEAGLACGRKPFRAGTAIRRSRRGLPEGLGERPTAWRRTRSAGLPHERTHQLTSCAAGSARDRSEIAIRLERGFLTGATRVAPAVRAPPISNGAWLWRAPATTKTSCSPRSPR